MKRTLYRFSVLLVLLIAVFNVAAFARTKAKTNDPAPAFSATDINGQQLSLEQLKGKIAVLNFWFAECAPCRKEMPELNKIVQKYKDIGDIVFIGFAMNEIGRLKIFFENNLFSYRTIPAAEAIAKSYGVSMFPTNLVIDKTGKIIYRKAGYNESTVQKLEKAIQKAVNK